MHTSAAAASSRAEVGPTPPPVPEVSDRVKRRSLLTTEALGFKSLSPLGSPFVSPYNSDDESEAAKRQKRQYFKRTYANKKFKDQVHGHIELPAACIAVMDTPQFQRLRNLKQLGAAYFVFPGASHNRFEHCVGVSHLAGLMAKHFKEKQPELAITDADVTCIQLAGLVHDLGHGPFSHMFDGEFIPRTRPDLGGAYSHELMTVFLLDELLRDNEINLADFGLDATDLLFVKEVVLGERVNGGIDARKGRPLAKSFLYDIVNNVHDGLDVDKLDYAERDARNTGVKSGCDIDRLIMESRVNVVNSRPRIVYPDKLVADVLAAFQTRFRLHHTVYQHRVVKAIEMMIVDSLVAADRAGVFSFRGRNRKDYALAEAIDDPVAFALTQDDVLQQIRLSRLPEANKARALVRRIDRRELYRSVGEVSVTRVPHRRVAGEDEDDEHSTLSQVERKADIASLFDLPEERICALLLETQAAREVNLARDEVIVEKLRVHHGAGASNPLERIYFYSKSNPIRARVLAPSKYGNMCPRDFIKEALRVFCTSTSKQRAVAVHDALLELTSALRNAPPPFLSLAHTPTFSGSQSSA